MFIVTKEQQEALNNTLEIVDKLDDTMPKKKHRASTDNNADNDHDDNNVEDDHDDNNNDDVEGRSQTLQAELDQLV